MSDFEYLGIALTSAETTLIESLLCLAGRTDPKKFESFNIEENLLLCKQCTFKIDSINL